ncbi:MAG: LysE family translocator [Crocinitomicaceae bacterium TMED135]|nr:MAG: LysE family translocator [Crocinitomicaceae bacterium TMED135]|tara:strand:- start:228 stop:812 length:585 start_codon:yes stop_codon:yes gene_type:complete
MDQILLFFISSLALTLMPGPDILFVINQSLDDKKSGLLVTFGLCSGLIIHTLILALGLSAIIEQNDNVIMFFKYFGSFYLFYLASQEFKKDIETSVSQKENFYLRGVYMNLINPKVLIFFLAYFPNFLFSDTISISYQFITLGAIFILQALIVFSIVSISSNRLISILKVDTNNKKIVYLKSFIFVLIGVSILF